MWLAITAFVVVNSLIVRVRELLRRQAAHPPRQDHVRSVALAAAVLLQMLACSGTPLPAGAAGCPRTGTTVGDAAQLAAALRTAASGGVILLAPGTYAGHFVASTSGTADAPITLCGSRDATIDGGAVSTGYTLHLDGASWWRLVGFTVRGGQKGVVTDHASHVLISGLFVHGVGDEGIHLRSSSSDDTIEHVVVRDTGRLSAGLGEGIYVGSAGANWCRYSACGPDTSDRDVIRNSDVSQTTAENIDIKEGTTGGTIAGNRLSGAGMDPAVATAWVNVKGNDWTISGNVGERSVRDGFQVHQVAAGWGYRNVFRGNRAAVDGPGYGIYVQSASLATLLACDNAATGAGSGLSNASCCSSITAVRGLALARS
jgi:hypothetical protein